MIFDIIPGAHYAACLLLTVGMTPSDLRMKKVFEEARRREEGTCGIPAIFPELF